MALTAAVLAAMALASGCATSDFAGGARSTGEKRANKNDDNADDVGPQDPAAGTGTLREDGGATAVDGSTATAGTTGILTGDAEVVVRGECTINPAYNPQDIQCSLPVAGPNIWTATQGWNTGAAAFKDRGAAWISPLPPTLQDGKPLCPHVPASEKLIYVSYFRITAAGNYTVESLNDNQGHFRLWKNADPGQQVLVEPTSEVLLSRTITLQPGHYSIVIDGLDTGVASAVLASVHAAGNPGQVIQNSGAGKDWCIFRVTAATDVVSYVREAAACRKCLVGP